MDQLQKIEKLLSGSDEKMSGSGMTDDEAKVFVRERFPFASYCLVRDWIWIDLDIPDEQHRYVESQGLKAVAMYAHTVVYDSAHRWSQSGGFVRTTLLHVFSDGCVFRTLNTTYVLLGNGRRTHADPQTIAQLF